MVKLFDTTLVGNDKQSAIDFITDILQVSTGNSIIIKDLNGTILLWNEGARQLYGYTAEEVVGKMKASRLHTLADVQAGKPQEMMQAALTQGKWEGILTRVKKNGEQFIAHAVMTPRFDRSGKPIGFLLISTDVTKEQDLLKQLKEALSNLERSNKELEQFAYIASHDLQEPLRSVESYVQLLARPYKDKLDQDANDFINYAVEGTERMQRLINDLLEYSRVVTRAKPLVTADANIILQRALLDLKEKIEESKAKITSDHLPMVQVDDIQLEQVFQNLISNSIKFCETQPVIHVGVKEDEKNWILFVRDNGIGINSEDQKRIFVLFERLHPKQKYPGTGMGLPICQKIIERHGGKIWVKSEGENKGSIFYFTLPKLIEKL